MTLRVVVLASGSGSNMVSLVEKCQSGLVDAEVRLLVTDRPQAPCLAKAQSLGVPATLALPAEPSEPRESYDARLREAVALEQPDLIVLAGFMRILTPTFLDAFKGRVVNIHPALLPSFKGAHGIRDTLTAGARLAGCTTHFVTAELDGGPMILQAALAVAPDDDQESLAAKVLALEHQILPRTVDLVAAGEVRMDAGRAVLEAKTSWAQHPDAPAPVPGALYSVAY